MGNLITRRLAAMIPVLVLVTFGVFALIHLTPGDPVDAMMAESFDPAAKERIRLELGLDQPIHIQYVSWISKVVQGDFGRSIRDNQPVIENVSRRNFLQGMFSASAFVICARTSPLLATAARSGTPRAGVAPSIEGAAFHPGVYLGINPDGTVVIVAHRTEMGNGVRTSLPRIVADELDAEPDEIYVQAGLLAVTDVTQMIVDDRPDLLFPPYTPRFPERRTTGRPSNRAAMIAAIPIP